MLKAVNKKLKKKAEVKVPEKFLNKDESVLKEKKKTFCKHIDFQFIFLVLKKYHFFF